MERTGSGGQECVGSEEGTCPGYSLEKTLKFGSFQKIRALFVDVARLKRTVAAKCLRTAGVRFTFLTVSVVKTCRSSAQTNNRAHTNNEGSSRMIWDLSLS